MVFTGEQGNSDTNRGGKQEEMTSSNHITVQECEDSMSEIELIKTSKALEDGGASYSQWF